MLPRVRAWGLANSWGKRGDPSEIYFPLSELLTDFRGPNEFKFLLGEAEFKEVAKLLNSCGSERWTAAKKTPIAETPHHADMQRLTDRES